MRYPEGVAIFAFDVLVFSPLLTAGDEYYAERALGDAEAQWWEMTSAPWWTSIEGRIV